MRIQRELEIGENLVTIETGHMAKQANGSCTVRCGDTLVLTTACMAGDPTAPRPFLPLTVEYREYSASAGRIPGGFFKREGRPSEKEIISCRLTDRPLRPLFPKGYYAETQIISMVMSADDENDPDVLAINAASFALVLSDIPFYHPIGAVRVGLIDDELIFNPTNSQRDISDLDLIVVGTEEAVVMVEAGANQLAEDIILDAIFAAHEELQKIIRLQHDMFRESGLSKPMWEEPEAYPQSLYDQVEKAIANDLRTALNTAGKFERKKAVGAVVDGFIDSIPEDEREETVPLVRKCVNDLESDLLAEAVLDKRQRFDGRALDEIRDIAVETGTLPSTHGSSLFTRGETQALVSATLGTRRDAQIIEDYAGDSLQKFILHYNFPPFSVGEVRFMRGPGRREIGHGVLARRSLMPVLPHEDDFPYTVRLVSDILESNGSSSMATVCGGSLALFDVGVPMLGPGGRRGHGPHQAWRSLRRALRHRRSGRPPRRHGLQGGGHPGGHQRPSDGHQDHRREPRDHGPGPGAGSGGSSAHPRHHGRTHSRSAGGDLPPRPAPLHSGDPAGQDSGHHRPRRQDHPLHPGRNWLRGGDRQRGQGHRGIPRRHRSSACYRAHRAHHRGARRGQDLRGCGHPHRVLRRLCRDPAGQRRSAAHQ